MVTTMRRTLSALLPLLLAAAASGANLPLKINFQGKLIDPATYEPRNGAFTMTLRLYNAPTGGSVLFTETQTGVPVSNGVFSVQVGSTAYLAPELFSGASAYLSVQVSPDASEMSPRQQLNMSAYAYAAAQLVSDGPAGVRVGNAYSSFTSAGNLLLSAGVQGSSGSFTNGVTAASGTFTQANGGYAVHAASGVRVSSGTLLLEPGSRGLNALGTGVTASTATLWAWFQSSGPATAQAVSPQGTARLYFDGLEDDWRISASGRAYTPLGSMSTTLWNSDATAAVGNQGQNLPAALTELDSAVQGTRMLIDCDDLPAQLALRYNFRALAATSLTIVISVRDVTNTANVLATVSQAVNATQNWLGQGAYSAKPGWCTGTQTVAVYTSGGNGAWDAIFKSIVLVGKP
jgi:hypothetical protein